MQFLLYIEAIVQIIMTVCKELSLSVHTVKLQNDGYMEWFPERTFCYVHKDNDNFVKVILESESKVLLIFYTTKLLG